MFYDDHAPPHFHAEYREFSAQVALTAPEIMGGSLPGRARRMVIEWAELHRVELLEDWELCQRHDSPKQVPPLE